MAKFPFLDLGARVKEAVCRRNFQPGDVVLVGSGDWPAWSHPRGGLGSWAVYVGRSGGSFKVRPMDRDMVTAAPVVVTQIKHLDDVEVEKAVAHYRSTKTRY